MPIACKKGSHFHKSAALFGNTAEVELFRLEADANANG